MNNQLAVDFGAVEEITFPDEQKYDVTRDYESSTIRDQILRALDLDLNFSDIFVRQGSPLKVKMPRGFVSISSIPVSAEDITQFYGEIEPDWERRIKIRAFDRAISLTKSRIRSNCFTSVGRKSYGAVIRRFPNEPYPLDTLGLRPSAYAFTKVTHGLVLIIGDTCQGKSTTIASMMHEINKNRYGHILTIEDPVEVLIPERNCLINQREVGPDADVQTFAMGAQDALRQRPDVIVIGEIREDDCAREAMVLGESGPAVYATLHAKSIELGLYKLWRMLGGTAANAQNMANILKGVLCQALVPSIEGDRYHLATECMTMNPQFAKLIEEMKFNDVRQLMSKLAGEMDGVNKYGCHPLNNDLLKLVKEKKISVEDAIFASNDKTGELDFEQHLRRAASEH